MLMNKLALLGGDPVRRAPFPPHPVLGSEEEAAVLEVLRRGELSMFIASPGAHFLGGRKVKEFEQLVAGYHGVRFAVAFNSATAALHAAVVATGVQPGEEVIVPPLTFTSTATCALMHNAVPVFADVEERTACLDPGAFERRISPLTKAVIPVHLFGHPAQMDRILAVARAHRLRVIEDCAQAPGARLDGRLAGTMGDCGILSFTQSKHVTTGEGGMLLTEDAAIADGARLIRNHGEAVWEGQTARTYTSTILGWNYRMTELEAALGVVQFGRLDAVNRIRIELCDHLTKRLAGIPGLTPPSVAHGAQQVYYLYALNYDAEAAGLSRGLFVEALRAEGIPCAAGYVRPLYHSPIYRGQSYHCPVAERLHAERLVTLQIARPPATTQDMDDVIAAIRKVFEHREVLASQTAVEASTS